MPEIEGAIGRVQLTKLDNYIKIRNDNAKYLTSKVKDIKGIDSPFIPEYCEPAFNYWIGRINPKILGINKQELLQKFPKSKILYNKPLYKTKIFQEKIAYPKGCPWSCPFYGKKIDYTKLNLPVVEKITNEIFALDIHTKITKNNLDEYVQKLFSLGVKV